MGGMPGVGRVEREAGPRLALPFPSLLLLAGFSSCHTPLPAVPDPSAAGRPPTLALRAVPRPPRCCPLAQSHRCPPPGDVNPLALS